MWTWWAFAAALPFHHQSRNGCGLRKFLARLRTISDSVPFATPNCGALSLAVAKLCPRLSRGKTPWGTPVPSCGRSCALFSLTTSSLAELHAEAQMLECQQMCEWRLGEAANGVLSVSPGHFIGLVFVIHLVISDSLQGSRMCLSTTTTSAPKFGVTRAKHLLYYHVVNKIKK